MCGIAGFQFAPRFKPDLLYRSILLLHLATAMDVRGGDSYGVAKLNNKGELRLWKGLGYAMGNLKLKEAADTNQLILHTRKRTHGPIDLYNAHPIVQGHIVGTHNGMVSNHDSLNREYNRNFTLDSRHIFEHLNLGLDVGEIGVYGALSWIDTNQPDMINLCRLSTHGDLEVYGIGNNKEDMLGVVYASTKTPIEAAFRALHQPCFRYEGVVEKQRYWISEGRLYTDARGKMPFGENPLSRGWTNTGFGLRSGATARPWVPPAGMRLCKKCKKNRKKEIDKFSSVDLCIKCWRAYKDTWPIMTKDDEKKSDYGLRMCSGKCGKPGVIRYGLMVYCNECWSGKPQEIKDILAAAPPPSTLLKPGEVSKEELEAYEKGEYKELLDLTSGRKPGIIPPYLEQWDLCTWCAAEVYNNKKWNYNDFCDGCKGKWDGMMVDMRKMDKEERRLFSQVAQCSKCHVVPTFGYLRSEAYADDGKCRVACKRCSLVARPKTLCSLCGEPDEVRMTFAQPIIADQMGKLVELVPYCRKCFEKRGEIVALVEEQEEDKESENGSKANKKSTPLM